MEQEQELTTVRAKFMCNDVFFRRKANGDISSETVRFNPAYSNVPGSENRAFWESTPSGSLEMTINNPTAFGRFKPGTYYYLDFTEAPAV